MDFLNLLLLENLICQIFNVSQNFSNFRVLVELLDPYLEEFRRNLVAFTQSNIVCASEIIDSALDCV
jgi:hypothetical protein